MKIRESEIERVSAAMASAQDNAKNQKVGTTKADTFADQARAFLAGMCAVGAFVHNMGDAMPDEEPIPVNEHGKPSPKSYLDTWGSPSPPAPGTMTVSKPVA